MASTSMPNEITQIVSPVAGGGTASSAQLSIALLWNESFWPITQTLSDAGTRVAPAPLFSSPEGLSRVRLSAVSTLARTPRIAVGRATRKQPVLGLTFGAVK